jgi:hypothetical protein
MLPAFAGLRPGSFAYDFEQIVRCPLHAHHLAVILARMFRRRIGYPLRRKPICLSHPLRQLGQILRLVIGQSVIEGAEPCG